MPVITPLAGGMPDAMAMPMHNGRATRKTTTDAIKSRGSVALSVSAFIQKSSTRGDAPGASPEAKANALRPAVQACR